MSRDEHAWRAALRLVAERPRTVAELRRRLRGKGFDADAVEKVLEAAKADRLVDDRLFAKLYAEDRLMSRPCARPLLIDELIQRGVAAPLAREAAEDALPEEDTYALAARALQDGLPRWRGLTSLVAQRRAAAYLQRRGFRSDVVRTVVREALGTPWQSESE